MVGWWLRRLVVVEDRFAAHSDQAADEVVKPKLVIGMRALLRGATVLPKFRYLKFRYSPLLPRKEVDLRQRYVGVERVESPGLPHFTKTPARVCFWPEADAWSDAACLQC